MQVQAHASMNPSTTSSVASLGNIGRWAVAPLHNIEVLHLYRWYKHTLSHTEGPREHQHNTPGPERENPGKARKKKEKRRPTDDGTRPAEGGEGRKRLNQPNTAKTYAYLGTRRTKPT